MCPRAHLAARRRYSCLGGGLTWAGVKVVWRTNDSVRCGRWGAESCVCWGGECMWGPEGWQWLQVDVGLATWIEIDQVEKGTSAKAAESAKSGTWKARARVVWLGERVRQEGSDGAGNSEEGYGDKCFCAVLKGLNFIQQNPRTPWKFVGQEVA